MILSILKESKADTLGREVENRVILIPALVAALKRQCPQAEVWVEANAGIKIDYKDEDYLKAGATKTVSHDQALSADLVLGVKETKNEDFNKIKGKIFMSYQHFAESKDRTNQAIKSGATFICLETMETEREGRKYFPCLAPMSEAAARILVRHADWFALLSRKTIGNLRATILGAGAVGRCAAKEFSLRGYEVHLIDRVSLKKLPSSIKGSFFAVSSMYTTGKSPEKLITRELLATMLPGGCVYPVDIDQGGGIEGALQTSILDPFNLPKIGNTDIFCFAPPNLPSLGARTTSEALGSAVLPYIIEIINLGIEKAAEKNLTIKSGINISNNRIIHSGLAEAFT